jgi:hypothetical protein
VEWDELMWGRILAATKALSLRSLDQKLPPEQGLNK